MRSKQDCQSIEKSSPSKQKYTKFKGTKSSPYKKKIEFNLFEKSSRSVPKITNQNILALPIKSDVILKAQKNKKAPSQSIKSETKRALIWEIVQKMQDFIKQLNKIIRQIKIQANLTFCRITKEISQELHKFLGIKAEFQKDTQIIFNDLKIRTSTKKNFISQNESFSTQERKCQKDYPGLYKTPKQNKAVKAKNQIKMLADEQDHRRAKSIERGNKSVDENSPIKRESVYFRQRQSRSRSKQIAKHLEGIQSKLNSIKKTLQH